MRKTLELLCCATVLLIAVVAVNAQSDWEGIYTFDEDGGKNAGGVAILITHELRVFDDGERGLAANINSQGYQTSADLVCTAKIVGTKLMIYFQSYGEDNMFEPYKPGDLLLTLERTTSKGKTVVLTHWGKYTAAIPRNQKSGKVYFEKALEILK